LLIRTTATFFRRKSAPTLDTLDSSFPYSVPPSGPAYDLLPRLPPGVGAVNTSILNPLFFGLDAHPSLGPNPEPTQPYYKRLFTYRPFGETPARLPILTQSVGFCRLIALGVIGIFYIHSISPSVASPVPNMLLPAPPCA